VAPLWQARLNRQCVPSSGRTISPDDLVDLIRAKTDASSRGDYLTARFKVDGGKRAFARRCPRFFGDGRFRFLRSTSSRHRGHLFPNLICKSCNQSFEFLSLRHPKPPLVEEGRRRRRGFYTASKRGANLRDLRELPVRGALPAAAPARRRPTRCFARPERGPCASRGHRAQRSRVLLPRRPADTRRARDAPLFRGGWPRKSREAMGKPRNALAELPRLRIPSSSSQPDVPSFFPGPRPQGCFCRRHRRAQDRAGRDRQALLIGHPSLPSAGPSATRFSSNANGDRFRGVLRASASFLDFAARTRAPRLLIRELPARSSRRQESAAPNGRPARRRSAVIDLHLHTTALTDCCPPESAAVASRRCAAFKPGP